MSILFSSQRFAFPRIRSALVVLASAGMLALTASTARAAEQWNDGVPAMSTQVKCVIGLQETGAIAKAGYLADPSKLPQAGQVFYGHADFGATTDTACSSGDQVAELDVVLPPGVSLAVDAAHPIACLYADDDGPGASYPTCPTHAIAGAYGPAIPSDDAGHAWTMPAGREFDVRFPLRSDRKLAGPAGGHCPQSVDEIPTSPQRDCLLIALHVADGYSDPWLTPSEELFIDPAAAGPAPTPGPNPQRTPNPTSVVSQIAFTSAHLAAVAKKGLGLSMRCATACKGNVKVQVAAATAKRLHLAKGALTLTSGRFSAAAGRTATVHLKLSRRLAGKVRRLRSLAVTVTVTPSGAAKTVAHLTLHR
ncbi:MAG: hypothetical protein QOK49_3093 [Baekduia sp.]|nr:hypothetical protein [Baekduia sp.]